LSFIGCISLISSNNVTDCVLINLKKESIQNILKKKKVVTTIYTLATVYALLRAPVTYSVAFLGCG